MPKAFCKYRINGFLGYSDLKSIRVQFPSDFGEGMNSRSREKVAREMIQSVISQKEDVPVIDIKIEYIKGV